MLFLFENLKKVSLLGSPPSFRMKKNKMDTQENTPLQTETQSSSSDQSDITEQTIFLSQLFPDAQRDLDALFPDPCMKKFLKELTETRKKKIVF